MREEKNNNYHLNRILKYIKYILEYYETIKNQNKIIMPNDQDSDGIIYKFLQLKEEWLHHWLQYIQPTMRQSIQSLL